MGRSEVAAGFLFYTVSFLLTSWFTGCILMEEILGSNNITEMQLKCLFVFMNSGRYTSLILTKLKDSLLRASPVVRVKNVMLILWVVLVERSLGSFQSSGSFRANIMSACLSWCEKLTFWERFHPLGRMNVLREFKTSWVIITSFLLETSKCLVNCVG